MFAVRRKRTYLDRGEGKRLIGFVPENYFRPDSVGAGCQRPIGCGIPSTGDEARSSNFWPKAAKSRWEHGENFNRRVHWEPCFCMRGVPGSGRRKEASWMGSNFGIGFPATRGRSHDR
jgi:hypothetical protein